MNYKNPAESTDPELLKFFDKHKNARFMFQLIEYYESDMNYKLDYSSFDEPELRRFILWFFLHRSLKESTLRAYIKTLISFLKEICSVNIRVPRISDIHQKLRILTLNEIVELRRTQEYGPGKVILELLEFRIETGCLHDDFNAVIPQRVEYNLKNYFCRSMVKYRLKKYEKNRPRISKKDFDEGLRQLLICHKINRKVKVGDKLIPIHDMDIDLLISNTFMYQAMRFAMAQHTQFEMFEHDDFTHFFPAVSCLNNQFIYATYSKSEVKRGLFMFRIMNECFPSTHPGLDKMRPEGSNLLQNQKLNIKASSKKPVSTAASLVLNRFQFYTHKESNTDELFSIEPAYMESQGFNSSEIILTDYLTLMHKYGKKDLN